MWNSSGQWTHHDLKFQLTDGIETGSDVIAAHPQFAVALVTVVMAPRGKWNSRHRVGPDTFSRVFFSGCPRTHRRCPDLGEEFKGFDFRFDCGWNLTRWILVPKQINKTVKTNKKKKWTKVRRCSADRGKPLSSSSEEETLTSLPLVTPSPPAQVIRWRVVIFTVSRKRTFFRIDHRSKLGLLSLLLLFFFPPRVGKKKKKDVGIYVKKDFMHLCVNNNKVWLLRVHRFFPW